MRDKRRPWRAGSSNSGGPVGATPARAPACRPLNRSRLKSDKPRPFRPPFHERSIVDDDGSSWGVYATQPRIAGGFGRPPQQGEVPRARFMVFMSQDGRQAETEVPLMHPGHQHDRTDDAELLELLRKALIEGG